MALYNRSRKSGSSLRTAGMCPSIQHCSGAPTMWLRWNQIKSYLVLRTPETVQNDQTFAPTMSEKQTKVRHHAMLQTQAVTYQKKSGVSSTFETRFTALICMNMWPIALAMSVLSWGWDGMVWDASNMRA
jgi:hypothetical protein